MSTNLYSKLFAKVLTTNEDLYLTLMFLHTTGFVSICIADFFSIKQEVTELQS